MGSHFGQFELWWSVSDLELKLAARSFHALCPAGQVELPAQFAAIGAKLKRSANRRALRVLAGAKAFFL